MIEVRRTTTEKPTTTTPYWWYPDTNRRAAYKETKTNEISYQPASEVLLKFKRWKGPIVENSHKDDFIVIESDYKPEIIEALV